MKVSRRVSAAATLRHLPSFHSIFSHLRAPTVCYEYKYLLALARCTREGAEERGTTWLKFYGTFRKQSEPRRTGEVEWFPSASVCTCGEIYMKLDFFFFFWTTWCTPPFLSRLLWISQYWHTQIINVAAYTTSARGVNPISAHKHKPCVLLAVIKPLTTSVRNCNHESSKALWFGGAENIC